MRFKQLLTEDELQREKEKTKKHAKAHYADPTQGPSIDGFGDPTSKGSVAAASKEKTRTPSDAQFDELPGNTKTADQTRATSFGMPQGAGDVMGKFMSNAADVTDTVDVDAPAYDDVIPEPKPPGQDVATVGQALSMEGADVNLNWHDVSALPGYAVEQIRGAFRPLFDSIISNQLEDIQVATTLGGDSSEDDFRNFIGFIGHHGQKRDDFSLEAFGLDPQEYHVSKAQIFYLNGFNFFIMKEKMMGQSNWYVYSGHAKDSPQLKSDDDLKQLT